MNLHLPDLPTRLGTLSGMCFSHADHLFLFPLPFIMLSSPNPGLISFHTRTGSDRLVVLVFANRDTFVTYDANVYEEKTSTSFASAREEIPCSEFFELRLQLLPFA